MQKTFLILLFGLLLSQHIFAHPAPNSVLWIDLQPNGFEAQLQMPLNELQLAMQTNLTEPIELFVQRNRTLLANYVLKHFRVLGDNGSVWKVMLKSMNVGKAGQTATGVYDALNVFLWVEKPENANLRKFSLYDDVIVHQVVTHKTLIAIRQDWDNGQIADKQNEIGVIELDVRDNIVRPFQVNLTEGSNWKGFVSMVQLGITHIAEGTDHLLFLLVLLLPAPLLVERKKWAASGGTMYSVIRLLKIATAFTIGHSITLLLGAIGWVHLPQQPVEVFIAITIFITAIHALRPIFPNREIFVASGFGLIHGLAFAAVLANLHITKAKMALSILGFNLGIELMQLFVIILTVPWLVILSQHAQYQWIRVGGAIFALIASLAWMLERLTQKSNIVTELVQKITDQGKWLVLGLAILAIGSWLVERNKKVQES